MNPQFVPRKSQLPFKSWISKVTCCLSIRQKIASGYVLALGIAILGTTNGILIGDHYEQQAKNQKEDAQEEIIFLTRLQVTSLQTQAHQQKLIYFLGKPELLQTEKSNLQKQAAEFKQLWSKFQSVHQDKETPNVQKLAIETTEAKRFLQIYKDIPDTYLRQTEELLQKVDSSNLNSQEVEILRKQLLAFANSSAFMKFDEFSKELAHFLEFANQEYTEARANEDVAEAIRTRVVGVSLVLSVVIAIILALYISHAIARPIQATTKVAQQVTQQKNFDLQAPVTTEDEIGALATSFNQMIQQVKQLLAEQKAANEVQLIQNEKMSSLGRMMAGVAHEINNPINFIYGNSIHASEYVEELLALLETYTVEIPLPPPAVQTQAEAIDLDFLKEDLPKLLESIKIGAERARQIILSLKDFSRLDEAEADSVDLEACIDSALIILNNRIKNHIEIIQNYSNIPQIEGYAGLLYQVLTNLLINAIDALQDMNGNKVIVISTEQTDQDWVVLKIVDNGSGIPPENQAKIFDTFFTTKPRGVGTGLGLAISRQIIVEKHGGKITCKSEVGVGTEFAIALPIQHPCSAKASNKNFLLATASA